MVGRTDLALEAKEMWEESAGETTALPGVAARESVRKGIRTTQVRVLDRRGEEALQKPVGTYLTLELSAFARRERNSLKTAAGVLGRRLRELMRLRQEDPVLVVGLGNRAVTPDAVGPMILDHLLATRHLIGQLPAFFAAYRSVAAMAPGVLGVTGIESVEAVRGVVDRVRPAAVIVVDALASRSLERICTTVQLADTGITPGSGVSNAREAFNRETLGVPVYAVGVPTVADLGTLMQDYTGEDVSQERLDAHCGGLRMIVTPQDIDARVAQIAKLIGLGVNLALHNGVSLEDILCFTE